MIDYIIKMSFGTNLVVYIPTNGLFDDVRVEVLDFVVVVVVVVVVVCFWAW
jgi:hypothetical protein